MTSTRERLQEALAGLPDDQLETVLRFAEALRKGRAVVAVCEPVAAEPSAGEE